jgi:hypothetical protein
LAAAAESMEHMPLGQVANEWPAVAGWWQLWGMEHVSSGPVVVWAPSIVMTGRGRVEGDRTQGPGCKHVGFSGLGAVLPPLC